MLEMLRTVSGSRLPSRVLVSVFSLLALMAPTAANAQADSTNWRAVAAKIVERMALVRGERVLLAGVEACHGLGEAAWRPVGALVPVRRVNARVVGQRREDGLATVTVGVRNGHGFVSSVQRWASGANRGVTTRPGANVTRTRIMWAQRGHGSRMS